ncbi:MAG: hypothetical protein LIR50_05550 [Bacillota bacterium]|nr:hypothetical protein [Bacillota bacterium]
MEKFNITRETKRDLARNIKKQIGNNDYIELAVMYVPANNIHNGYFQAVETIIREKLENEGQCYYCLFTHNKTDGKLTLKDIENLIFS